MFGKKSQPKVINKIKNLNLEIDYDKLAEAIINAQKYSEEEANRQKKFTSGTFATLITVAFRGFSFLGWILVLTMLIAIWSMFESF
jgi:hypothetical protein